MDPATFPRKFNEIPIMLCTRWTNTITVKPAMVKCHYNMNDEIKSLKIYFILKNIKVFRFTLLVRFAPGVWGKTGHFLKASFSRLMLLGFHIVVTLCKSPGLSYRKVSN